MNRRHSALHHVVQVEHLVLQAGGDHHLAVHAELSFVDGELLQVDALDLRVRLSVNLKRNQVKVIDSTRHLASLLHRRPTVTYLEEGDRLVQAGRHDDLSGGVKLDGGQSVV